MVIREDEGFCTCCGNLAGYKYGEENYSLVVKNLDNYKKYKDLYIYKCDNCGFISDDITGEEGILYGDIKDSYEFKQLIDYSYLKGLDTRLYDYHSKDIPANMFEAYSLICKESGDYEKFVRTVNKAIELKEMLIRKYKRSQEEIGGEDENDDEYEELYALLHDSIKINTEQIDYYYNLVETKNLFLTLIYIENLIRQNKKLQAKKGFDNIVNKIALSDDLKQYFAEKF